MSIIRVTDDSTPAEITEAISHLRARQSRCNDPDVVLELGETIDGLLDRLNEVRV